MSMVGEVPKNEQRPASRNWRSIADEIEAKFMRLLPPATYPSEWSFGITMDYRDWHEVVKALRAAPRSERGPSEPSITLSEISRAADHIQKNGISLAKFGGDSIHEGRCRELCAMYLREFVSNYHMGDRLKELLPHPAERKDS